MSKQRNGLLAGQFTTPGGLAAAHTTPETRATGPSRPTAAPGAPPTEAALARSEAQFPSMAEVMIWVAGPDGGATWFSQGWLDFTGQPMAHELGDGWMAGVHTDDLASMGAAREQAWAKHEPFETEYRLRDSQNRYRWVIDRGRPDATANGSFAGYVGSCLDITDRKRAEEALRLLSDAGATLTTTLDYLEAPARLAELAVPGLADWCTISLIQADGSLQRVSAAHADPSKLALLEQLEPYRLGEDNAVGRAIRDGVTGWAASITPGHLHETAVSSDHLDVMKALDPASTVVVPLIARGRTLGVFVCVRTAASPPYAREDVTVAEELARRAALAMDNARLYSDQQRANEALQLMADAGTELASSLEFDETLSNLARLVVPRFADWCSIDVIESDGAIRHMVVAHKDPAMMERARAMQERYATTEPRQPGEIMKRLLKGEPMLVRDVEPDLLAALAQDDSQRRLLLSLGLKSAIAVPLMAHNRTFGAISFFLTDTDRHYDEHDFSIAIQLGKRAGLYIDNARLYLESQQIESQLLRANEALRLLAEVGAQLGTSLEYEEAIASLARLAVPAFADVCWVDVQSDDGVLRRAVVEHRDPALAEAAAALQAHAFDSGQVPTRIQAVLRGGASQLYPDMTEEMLVKTGMGERPLAALRAIGPTSIISVALRARGRVFGAITFALNEGPRRYSQTELALAEDIANRGALFIDNARLYTEGQRREEELRRANEAKDEFLSMMSHELRTPLTVINGGARILRSRAAQLDEATRTSIINDIEQESDRLFRMVENLLSMAHIEFTEDAAIEPVLVQRLLDRVISSFRQRRPDRVVNVEVEAGLEAIAAEPTYLEQVVRNLLSNADKYSPTDTAVEIQVTHEGNEAAIRVIDSGVGIEPDEAERIFERFYRSERTSKLVGGSGVGLALCKRLVEAMSGRMWARPRPEGGLEVGFTLPLYEETRP